MYKNLRKIFLVLAVFTVISSGCFWASNSANRQTILAQTQIIGVAHAQGTTAAAAPWKTLHQDLSSPANGGNPDTAWIFDVWRVLMSVANVFVAIVLFFFAFVNIAHIDYDTYQLKKTFPKLIIGILLANFSMVICRMIADVASALTMTFAQDLRVMMEGVLCALGFGTGGGIGTAIWTIVTGGGNLLWFILIVIAIFIGILILGLLLLFRHVVILILAAAAPVAFIMLAFPPTEQYFKKWWEWFINWVFMGPIIMLLLWMAGMVGGDQCNSGFNLTRSFAALALVYLAAIVPFKLGGAVMGAIGNAGKKAGNFAANNPWSKQKRGQAQRWIDNKTPLGQMKHNFNKANEDLEADKKADAAKYEKNRRESAAAKGKSIESEEQRRIDAELNLKTGINTRAADYIKSIEGGASSDLARLHKESEESLEDEKARRVLEAYDDPAKQAHIKEHQAKILNTQEDLKKATLNLQNHHGNATLRGISEINRNEDLEAAHMGVVNAQAILDEAVLAQDTAQIPAAEQNLEAAKQAHKAIVDQTLDGAKTNVKDAEAAVARATTDPDRAAAQQVLDQARQVLSEAQDNPTNLKDAMKLIQEAQTNLSRARTPQAEAQGKALLQQRQSAADQLLRKAAERMVREKQIDPNDPKGGVFTVEKAMETLKKSNISGDSEKRYYALTSGRVADDVSTDAKSYSPRRVFDEFIDENGGWKKEGSYSGFAFKEGDTPAFFKGQALSSGDAGQCIFTNMGQLRAQLTDRNLGGSAFQTIQKLIDKGNPELNGGALKTSWDMSASAPNDRVRKSLLDAMHQSDIAKDITDPNQVTSEHLRQLGTQVQLNPNNPDHRSFMGYTASQLAEADGRSYQYTDDNGQAKTVLGRTGFGQAAWVHIKNSGDISSKIEAPTEGGNVSTGGSTSSTGGGGGGTGGDGTTTTNNQTVVNQQAPVAGAPVVPQTPAPRIIASPGAQFEAARLERAQLRELRNIGEAIRNQGQQTPTIIQNTNNTNVEGQNNNDDEEEDLDENENI